MGTVIEFGGSGSGSGSLDSSTVKRDSTAITTAGTDITFTEAFDDADYSLTWWAVNSNDENVNAVEISNKTATGFKATPVEDCTLNWHAIKNS